MGTIRVFKRSIRFTFRSKRRFIVFMLIFAIISSFVAFYIDSLDELRTDRFLEQKGVVMTQKDLKSVTYNQGENTVQAVLDAEQTNVEIRIEGYNAYHYADLDSFLRIYTFNKDKPWYSSFVKPSLVNKGKFPSKSSEVLVPSGSFQIRDSNIADLKIKTDIAVGQKLTFERPGFNNLTLKVSGVFDSIRLQDQPENDRLWLFVDNSKFEDMLTLFNKTTDDAFTYSISWIVPGNLLSKDTYKLVSALNDEIKNIIKDNQSNGDWFRQPDFLPSKEAQDRGSNIIVNLGVVVIGGILLSSMFAYLISRFRRREIAILKAMGYSNNSVRASLIAEILTIASVGFIVGVSIIQGLLYYISGFNRTSLLSSQALVVSFAINVVIALPGMLFVSKRVLGVSPSEVFRDR